MMYNVMKENYTTFLIMFTLLGMLAGHFFILPQGKYDDNLGIGGLIGFVILNTIYIVYFVIVKLHRCLPIVRNPQNNGLEPETGEHSDESSNEPE